MNIVETIQKFFQKNALKKCVRSEQTLLSIKEIHTVTVVLDVEDAQFNDCKEDIAAFFRGYDIRPEFFFFDFRKLEKNELLLTSIQNTILRKDLNWFGMPSQEKVNLITGKPCDLFISLATRPSFANEYFSTFVNARFKIGRVDVGEKVFDMVISGEGYTGRQIFAKMQEFLLKIEK